MSGLILYPLHDYERKDDDRWCWFCGGIIIGVLIGMAIMFLTVASGYSV